jgi:hypothetical protein
MNRTKIKNYAPQARRDFIQAVTDRAALYGLTENKTEPVVEKGDGVLIGGQAFPKKVGQQRRALEERIKAHGFSAAMETLAYTWFNRLVAIRFMEVNGYLENGEGGASYRVLSHPDGKPTPELLEHAEHADLPGLNKAKVIGLKIAGDKEAELYRMLLVAQCNALNSAMPFLFERIDDETELVLPDSLLHSDSLVRKLVAGIDEDDWKEVEVIGWLYEGYISERYEAVIGDVVASEDIPAATQRFTPKWIVRYLVQNTLGRTWLATDPHSDLRGKMKYYIEPAEQTPEVQEQLKAITPTDLNPEEITFLDPACGSAHILVEAYDVFKLIYQEKGYERRKIPTLILTKNLFGLEIDDRAAQLAAFALLMKARDDDRRLFHAEEKVRPNVLALQETKGLDAAEITTHLNEPVVTVELPPSDKLFEAHDDLLSKANLAVAGDLVQADIAHLIHLFENAKTFGSLIRIPPKLAEKLPQIEERVRLVAKHGEGFTRFYADAVLPVVEQAKLLASHYSCVVANPPYMGSKYYTQALKAFVNKSYRDTKADLYACFIQRNAEFGAENGFVGMITIPNWMFLASFEDVRESLLAKRTLDTFIHNGRGVFGSDFGSCSFVYRNAPITAYRGVYRRLFDKQGSVASNDELETRFSTVSSYHASAADLALIPGSPIAYWVGSGTRRCFAADCPLGKLAPTKIGMRTGDNDRFLRQWFEVSFPQIGFGFADAMSARASRRKWFPYNKGGSFRKWYGNNAFVVNWHNDGDEIKEETRLRYPDLGDRLGWKISNEDSYFQESITWTDISASCFGARFSDQGALFDVSGSSAFPTEEVKLRAIALLCSSVAFHCLLILNPTVHFQIADVAAVPFMTEKLDADSVGPIASEAIAIARADWNAVETAWDFQRLPVLTHKATTLQLSQENADTECQDRFRRMKELEEKNNRLFVEAYGLQEELSPAVPDDQVTLSRPERVEDIKRLVSYAIGCMMGRYSLDKPGLIYANTGNEGFDPSQYTTFPADPDGILPLTELDWGFPDDTAKRVEEFVGVAWPKEHLAENLKFIEDGLGTPIRKYLATGFYKDHLRWYKRRPIYWLFTSGKLRAFQCLVYLHRYHEGTLARMRTEYVNPLQSRITARIEKLEGDIAQAKGNLRTKLVKEQDGLKKQQTELLAFDERLKHAADQRITLDLDDGVKVNYGKFGDLLAEVKAVTGGKDEE